MALKIPKPVITVNALIKGVIRVFERDKIGVYAAQASFYTIISAIPLIMSALTALRFFVPVNEGYAAELIGRYVPSALIPLCDAIAEEIFGAESVKLLSLSALMLLWSASRGINGVGQGIMNVYGAGKRVGLIASTVRSLVFTLLFIAFMAASVSALLFGRILTDRIFTLAGIDVRSPLLIPLKAVVTLAFLTLTAVLIFNAYGSPGFRGQLPGALFSAAGQMLFSFGYTIYIDNFADYSHIYGSLTAVVLLMLWLYAVMLIMLVGAEINVCFDVCRKYLRKNCAKRIKSV